MSDFPFIAVAFTWAEFWATYRSGKEGVFSDTRRVVEIYSIDTHVPVQSCPVLEIRSNEAGLSNPASSLFRSYL